MQSHELEIAAKDSPADPQVYALLARSYANLANRERTLFERATRPSSMPNQLRAMQTARVRHKVKYSFPPGRL